MMEEGIENTFTVQGRDTPVPAIAGGVKSGPASSISNDCNDNNKCNELNGQILAFGRCSKVIRSPVLKNPHSSLISLDSPPAGENIFAKNSRVLRSPSTKSNPQHQHQLKKTQNKNEITESQVKEKVVDDTTIIERLNMFEKMCEALQKQVDDLKSENQSLKEALMKNEKYNDLQMEIETPSVIEFHTDEEELARETEWILSKNKKKNTKKRKAESSPEMDISLKCSKLVRESETLIPNQNKLAKKPKLPPVILSNITDFNKVQNVMSSQNIKYEYKLLNNEQLSIKVTSENDYRSLTKAINEAKFEWHSYENKATRPCKVIARGLHPSCNPECILDDLKELGFKVLSVVNLTKKKQEKDRQVKNPLPLFMIIFDHSEDIKKVFSITHIVKTKVKIEALRKQKDQIPQCKRCQRFEHTQAFCRREARCVKCAGSHLTIDCKSDRKETPKCSNCHEAHPANYRGCVVAKELQKRRSAKKKVEAPKPNQQKMPTPMVVEGVSYTEVVKKNIRASASDSSKAKQPVTPKGNRKPLTPKGNRQPVTPKGNKKVKSNTLGKNQMIISKGQKSPKKNIPNEDPLKTFMERMSNKIDEISTRLEKIEKRYASKHIGTPRSILKK